MAIRDFDTGSVQFFKLQEGSLSLDRLTLVTPTLPCLGRVSTCWEPCPSDRLSLRCSRIGSSWRPPKKKKKKKKKKTCRCFAVIITRLLTYTVVGDLGRRYLSNALTAEVMDS
uniref:Uncharacterized protein n=1 Tax=Mus musculus TaxID=10090 RepID=Q8BYC1_MOUSE|nr:unnamed protein product [Mus musculus]